MVVFVISVIVLLIIIKFFTNYYTTINTYNKLQKNVIMYLLRDDAFRYASAIANRLNEEKYRVELVLNNLKIHCAIDDNLQITDVYRQQMFESMSSSDKCQEVLMLVEKGFDSSTISKALKEDEDNIKETIEMLRLLKFFKD